VGHALAKIEAWTAAANTSMVWPGMLRMRWEGKRADKRLRNRSREKRREGERKCKCAREMKIREYIGMWNGIGLGIGIPIGEADLQQLCVPP